MLYQCWVPDLKWQRYPFFKGCFLSVFYIFVYVCAIKEYLTCWPKEGDLFAQVKFRGHRLFSTLEEHLLKKPAILKTWKGPSMLFQVNLIRNSIYDLLLSNLFDNGMQYFKPHLYFPSPENKSSVEQSVHWVPSNSGQPD